MRRGWICALAALLLAGCSIPHRVLSRRPEPSAQVRAIRALAFGLDQASLVVELELDNPGPNLELTQATYEVFLQGRTFATGTLQVQVRAPTGQRLTLALPIQLSYLGLPAASRRRFEAGSPLQLVVRGTLSGDTPAGVATSVGFDGETEISPGDDALPSAPAGR